MLLVQDLVATSVRERLNGVSFKIGNGEVLAVLGLNTAGGHLLGQVLAGKSGLRKTGQVQLNSYHYRSQIQKVMAQTGYLANPVQLPEYLSGFEFLDFVGSIYHLSPETRNKRIGELGETLKLGSDLFSIIESTSHDVRQKIAFAVSIIHKPRLLVLDEPTQYLDYVGQGQIKKLINEQPKEGTSVIIITNNLELATTIADRFVVMAEGQIALEGTLAQLVNQTKSRPKTLEGVMSVYFGNV